MGRVLLVRLTADTTLHLVGTRSNRHLIRCFPILVCLFVAGAVTPARARDRGCSRHSPARTSNGTQRWDFHHRDGELPLHIKVVDPHSTNRLDLVARTAQPNEDHVVGIRHLRGPRADSPRNAGWIRPESKTRLQVNLSSVAQSRAPPT